MKYLKISGFLIFITANIFAQYNDNSGSLLKNLKKHIGYLSSDQLEGRRTGTRGEMKAVEYIVAQYKKIGIAPMGDKKSYVQSFEINEGREIKSTTHLKIGKEVLKLTDDYFPFSFSGNGLFNGNIRNGQLIEANNIELLDLKEKIEENQKNPHFDLLQYIQDKAKEVSQKNMKALLIYNSSDVNDSLNFLPNDKSNTLNIPVIFFTKNGMRKIKSQSSVAVEIAGNIDLGYKIRKAHNVVAYIDNKAANTIVIGGHLDHLGYGEDHNSRYVGAAAIHNGADDNASGTSAVVELARILKNSNWTNNNYCFVNFSGEELGLYGSKYFVEHTPFDIGKINYMINIDMIGRLNDSTKTLTVGGVGTSTQWSGITNENSLFKLKIDSSGTGPSDHTSFYRKNIPVLFFFTGLHADYHKPSDDADKINYAGEASIINYILKIVEATDSKGKLAFTKTKEQSMATSRFKVTLGIMPDYTFSGQGVKADGVVEGKLAQKIGLKEGDIIVQLGEHLITGMDTYMQALGRFNKGDSTKLVVKREGNILEFNVTF